MLGFGCSAPTRSVSEDFESHVHECEVRSEPCAVRPRVSYDSQEPAASRHATRQNLILDYERWREFGELIEFA